ncbi:MAG: KTSC domain-containing protein [Clostridiales bacterium]|nr:KTSC domain-containing protein [Clostridiales bacterium]
MPFLVLRLYAYNGVPESVYNALMTAASHGKYFHANIKDRYSYQKISLI